MQVVLGGVSLGMEESTEQTLQVEEAIVHENYRETPSSVANDIGDPFYAFLYAFPFQTSCLHLCLHLEHLADAFIQSEVQVMNVHGVT